MSTKFMKSKNVRKVSGLVLGLTAIGAVVFTLAFRPQAGQELSEAKSTTVEPAAVFVSKPATSVVVPDRGPSSDLDEAVAVRVRSVLYLSEKDAGVLGLNRDDRARFTRHCAEFAGRVLDEFARAGQLQRLADNEYLMSVRLTPEVAERLEADFLQELERRVGPKALEGLEKHPDVHLRVRFALFKFGAEPLVLQFRGNADTMAASERIEWTQAWRIDGDVARATTLSGSLTRSGFRAVYGPLAEAVGL